MNRRAFLVRSLGLVAMPALAAASPALAQDRGTFPVRDLYDKDRSFSAAARSLRGERVAITGFMAPPLKAESRFFVLTMRPMAVCPFCEIEAEWPDDIIAVYAKRTVRVVPYNVKIVARGRLELGRHRDPETGFLSRTRLVDAVYERSRTS